MTQLFSNNASATLSADITTVSTNIAVQAGEGALFNAPVAPDFEMITLSSDTGLEIVKLTSRTTDTLTIERAQEGTTALVFLADDAVDARITAGTLDTFVPGTSFDPNTTNVVLGLNASALSTQNLAIGENSYVEINSNRAIALGYNTWAETANAISLGGQAYSAAGGAMALGYSAAATGIEAIAIGWTASTSGLRSLSLGQDSISVGNDTIAIGSKAKIQNALYNNSIAIGSGADIWSASSVCIGYQSLAGGNGAGAVALGDNSTAGREGSIGVGQYASSSGDGAICIGQYTGTSNARAVVIGQSANGDAIDSVSIGWKANTRVTKSHVIAYPSIVRRDNNETAGEETIHYCGQENYQFSEEIDFTQAAADDIVSITLPATAKFFVNEVGFVVTTAAGVTVQPSISFGITGSSLLLLASTATNVSSNNAREKFDSLDINGQQSLTMSIKVSGAATTFLGRIYFKGLFLEDE